MTENTPFELTADLTMREVPSAWRRFRRQASAAELPTTIDLGNLERTDSSTLALLLDWQARAAAHDTEIRYVNPPESLRVIARLTEVDELLGWSDKQQEDMGQ